MDPITQRLAAAMRRRKDLDALARYGRGEPASVARANEADIRAAELALLRSVTSEANG